MRQPIPTLWLCGMFEADNGMSYRTPTRAPYLLAIDLPLVRAVALALMDLAATEDSYLYSYGRCAADLKVTMYRALPDPDLPLPARVWQEMVAGENILLATTEAKGTLPLGLVSDGADFLAHFCTLTIRARRRDGRIPKLTFDLNFERGISEHAEPPATERTEWALREPAAVERAEADDSWMELPGNIFLDRATLDRFDREPVLSTDRFPLSTLEWHEVDHDDYGLSCYGWTIETCQHFVVSPTLEVAP